MAGRLSAQFGRAGSRVSFLRGLRVPGGLETRACAPTRESRGRVHTRASEFTREQVSPHAGKLTPGRVCTPSILPLRVAPG